MHVISQKRIREAQSKWPSSVTALQHWMKIMQKTDPQNYSELKNLFNSVDKVGDVCVFNVGGNKIRLIAFVRYRAKRVYIRAILDHKEYDKNEWK